MLRLVALPRAEINAAHGQICQILLAGGQPGHRQHHCSLFTNPRMHDYCAILWDNFVFIPIQFCSLVCGVTPHLLLVLASWHSLRDLQKHSPMQTFQFDSVLKMSFFWRLTDQIGLEIPTWTNTRSQRWRIQFHRLKETDNSEYLMFPQLVLESVVKMSSDIHVSFQRTR